MLKLYLFGPPRTELDDLSVNIGRRKALALLVYLALTGRPHSRDALATLFYPDQGQSRARAYFRRDLGALNTQLKGDWLTVDREVVGIKETAEVWTDVAAFRHALEARSEHGHADDDVCPDCLTPLTTAVELYSDDLLAGFSLPDCPEFDEWQFFEAEKARREFAKALESLVRLYVGRGQYDQALFSAQRRLKLDPLHEPTHRDLMKLYALSGQRTAALRQYESCVAVLDEELGVTPEAETTALYEAIKARRLGQPTDQADVVLPGPSNKGMPMPEAPVQPQPAFLTEDQGQELTRAVFVARERELSQLAAALKSAKVNQGQIRFVIGGAGRGKTALARQFARHAQDEDPELIVVSGNGNAINGIGDPYLPFREALLMLTGNVEASWAGGLISRRHARQLWELMPVALPALVKHAPGLINSLVSGQALYERAAAVAAGDSSWFEVLTALVSGRQETDLDQKRIFAQYTALLKAIAIRRPLLLIIEDLHWVDAASSGLLFHLSREINDSRILVVGTYRPEEIVSGQATGQSDQHPLAAIVSELKRQYGDIWLDLGDLAAAEGRDFVDAYLDTQPNVLGKAFREALFQRTGGHALFTVELLQAMQDRGDLQQDDRGRWIESEAIDWAKLPVKVEGAIESRIERLSEDLRSILTIASVEGESFTAEVVADVQRLDGRTLVGQLSRELDRRHRLVMAQALEWLDSGQRLSIYRFRHQLFQHYLYNRLDDVEIGYLHEAVGNALEQLYQGQTEQVAGQLARHFELARVMPKAIAYLRKAGEVATRVYANTEAVAYYKRAAELAEHTGADAEELAHTYTQLGELYLVTKGDSAPEVGQAYERALELYRQAGEPPQLFTALRGLAMFNKLRGESETALDLTEQMMALASRNEEPELIVEACYAMGSLFFYSGEFVPAQKYLKMGINNYDPEMHQSLTLPYGQDPGVANLSYASLNLWCLGYPDQASERYSEALGLARELSHPYSIALALAFASWVSLFRREESALQELTEEIINLSMKYDFALFVAVGKLLGGWALVQLGRVEEGIGQMQYSLSTAALTNETQDAGSAAPHLLIQLVGPYIKVGRYEEGLRVVEQAIALIDKEQEWQWIESEVYRLKGESLRMLGASTADVEDNFLHAVGIARQQEAKSLELRATTSLSRLWRSQGKQKEARQMLATIYDWFSEGFDTLDLQEARALLDELS